MYLYKLTLNWKEEIKRYWNILYVESSAQLGNDFLWTTRCSKTKGNKKGGFPYQLYTAPINRRFYKYVNNRNLSYGIISDKYGIVLSNEQKLSYDLSPGQLSLADKRILGSIIKAKVKKVGFNKIVFYNTSPKMSIPYFQMLYFSGLEVVYITVLG